MSDDYEAGTEFPRIADSLEAMVGQAGSIAKSLNVIALTSGRIALALEDLLKTIPTNHERIQEGCLYALLINSGIDPSILASQDWATKLHDHVEAAKKIAMLANKGPQ